MHGARKLSGGGRRGAASLRGMNDFAVRAADLSTDSADRALVERLWLLFRHDMSAFTGALPFADGTFRRERLEASFTEEGWATYLFHEADRPVGFAHARNLEGAGPIVLSSFFLVAGVRRRGYGLRAALDVVRRHPGDWEVAFQDSNSAAVAFWPRVASAAGGESWRLEHRPIPGKPEIAPDAWISFSVPAATL